MGKNKGILLLFVIFLVFWGGGKEGSPRRNFSYILCVAKAYGADNSDINTFSLKRNLKARNFTKDEVSEIRRDGYLAYFFRRKYSPGEVKTVWNAVNKLFPQYTPQEKIEAVRTVLGYNWVVYRTTSNHNMAANVALARRYMHLIKKYSKLHSVPEEMAAAVITWENSGSIAKESWASCRGLGQMSWGAVKAAHDYYLADIISCRKNAQTLREWGKIFGFGIKYLALYFDSQADFYDVGKRHREMAKHLGISDERVIPDCNIEDAVLYLKILYRNYDNRVDHAISAYHNGGLNNNDILRNHLKRNLNIYISDREPQKVITKAIKDKNIHFIDLWRDPITRDMFNGRRTVYGEITNGFNSHLALVDESDIYLWKVTSAYGALNSSGEVLRGLMDKYRGDWDVAECRGMIIFDSLDLIKRAIRGNWLVKLPPVYSDKGIGALNGAGKAYYNKYACYNYYVTPETAGFLIMLARDYRARTHNRNVAIPLKAALESKVLEKYKPGQIPEAYHPHLQGVAVDIDLANAAHSSILYDILQEYYLHDRIFIVRKNGKYRVCVNPRFGIGYYRIYRDYQKTKKI